MSLLAALRKAFLERKIVSSGYGAIKAGCDRRKFKRWADKLKVKPLGRVQEGAEPSNMDPEIFLKDDADRVITAILEDRAMQKAVD